MSEGVIRNVLLQSSLKKCSIKKGTDFVLKSTFSDFKSIW